MKQEKTRALQIAENSVVVFVMVYAVAAVVSSILWVITGSGLWVKQDGDEFGRVLGLLAFHIIGLILAWMIIRAVLDELHGDEPDDKRDEDIEF